MRFSNTYLSSFIKTIFHSHVLVGWNWQGCCRCRCRFRHLTCWYQSFCFFHKKKKRKNLWGCISMPHKGLAVTFQCHLLSCVGILWYIHTYLSWYVRVLCADLEISEQLCQQVKSFVEFKLRNEHEMCYNWNVKFPRYPLNTG